ncbi:MAG: hypothetical protein ABIF11_12220 [Nitrospirota bacterium]
MENLDNEEYETERNKEFILPRKKYYLILLMAWGIRLISLILGVCITGLLYYKCLFNPNCNTIVTIYFAILGLTFFTQAGIPIDKLANIKLT